MTLVSTTIFCNWLNLNIYIVVTNGHGGKVIVRTENTTLLVKFEICVYSYNERYI